MLSSKIKPQQLEMLRQMKARHQTYAQMEAWLKAQKVKVSRRSLERLFQNKTAAPKPQKMAAPQAPPVVEAPPQSPAPPVVASLSTETAAPSPPQSESMVAQFTPEELAEIKAEAAEAAAQEAAAMAKPASELVPASKPIELSMDDLEPAPAGAPGASPAKPAKDRTKWAMAKSMAPKLLKVEETLIKHFAKFKPEEEALVQELHQALVVDGEECAALMCYYYMPEMDEKLEALCVFAAMQAAALGPLAPRIVENIRAGQKQGAAGQSSTG